MTRRAARILLLSAVGLLALEAGLARSAAAPAAKKSKKELLADLPAEEQAWLTEYVAPIILPEEEKLFLELTQPHERELFKREFWQRRERDGLPLPLGPGYRERYGELRRLADEVYDGWRQDAGRMVLRWGEPTSIKVLGEECRLGFRNVEIWTYTEATRVGRGVFRYLFSRLQTTSHRRLWTVGVPDSEVLAPGSCRKKLEELSLDCIAKKDDACRDSNCEDACDVYRVYAETRDREGNARAGAASEYGRLLQPFQVSTEDLGTLKKQWAGTSDASAKPLSVTGPSSVVKASRKELLAALPDEERVWLTDFVAPIILKDEEDLFLELTEGYQREMFKKDFWERREMDSLGPPYGEGFQRRYEELRPRLDSEYDGWRSDAARMVLHYGEPAEIRRTEGCNGSVFRDLEIWTVQSLAGTFRQTVHHIFYRPNPGVPRRLWVNESTALNRRTGNGCQGSSTSPDNKLFQPSSCRKDFQSLLCDCRTEPSDPCLGPVCSEACDVYRIYQEILARQGSTLGALSETGRLFKLPDVSTEGLDRLRKRFATTVDPKARPLSVEGPTSKPKAAAEPTPTPEPVRALTAEEIRDRIVHLEPKYRQFLDLAGPLLTEDALQRFLQMTPRDKDRFIKEFWKRRS